MSKELNDTNGSGRRPIFILLGTLRIVLTVAFSWMLAVKLTPPNKPVENRFELLFPGFVIIVLGLPAAAVGIALHRHGARAVGMAVRADILAVGLLVLAFLMVPSVWVLVVALPFAVDLWVMVGIRRETRDIDKRE